MRNKLSNTVHCLILLLMATVLVFLAACEVDNSRESKSSSNNNNSSSESVRNITISSTEQLFALFEQKNYSTEAWRAGIRKVPRIYITDISTSWQENAQKMPVITKKEIFFHLVAPLVLASNEAVLEERQRLLEAERDLQANQQWLLQLAVKYKLKAPESGIDENLIKELTRRVDIIPLSLALAQSAEESGWGTSRFAVKGNALFGQWDFSGGGIKPKQQRKELGNYGIAKFDSPMESVAAYMLNLNTHSAYQRLRASRAEMRGKQQVISGYQLAATLDKYSERGQAYVETLHSLMRVNHLQETDTVELSGDEIIYLHPGYAKID